MDDSSDDDLEIGPQKSAEELLRERGLPVSGRKAELVARLAEAAE